MSAQYEWQKSEDGAKDFLFREDIQIGEVSAMGQLWISAVLRPSKIKAGQVDDRAETVKGALSSRDGARMMTLKQAQFFWDGLNAVEGAEALGGGLAV